MITHFANFEDVSEWARHHDWPIRPGMTLQNHLRNVLTVYYNELQEYRCDTRCVLTLLVKRSHDAFAFSATVRQTDIEKKIDYAMNIEGHMTVYTRVELDENSLEGAFYLPRMFTHVTGEVIPIVDIDEEGTTYVDVDVSEYA